MMDRSALYPYELLSLLEELEAAPFSGTVALRSDGFKTVLYVRDGTVRYARSDRLLSSFAAYLTTERVFAKAALRGYLAACTEQGTTLERHLLEAGVCSTEDLRHLKRDLARQVFARAFCQASKVGLHADIRRTPEYRQPPMDPFDAFFRCVAEHPAHAAIEDLAHRLQDAKVLRGPRFFALLPAFRRAFGRSSLLGLLEAGTAVAALPLALGPETGIKQLFASVMSAMAQVDGEAPRHARLGLGARARPDFGLEERTPGYLGPSAALGADLFTPGLRLALETTPGLRLIQDEGGATEPAVVEVPAPGSAEGERPPGNPDDEPWESLSHQLQSDHLIEAADQVSACNHYTLFGVGPWVAMSQLRASYRQAWREYGPERFAHTLLTAEAADALERIRSRIELAYEVLTSRHERWSYNLSLGLEAEMPFVELDALFRGEETFAEARTALAAGDWSAAREALERAVQHNAREPEYLAYLAWVVACAGEEGALDAAEKLVLRALEMEPQLEAGWVIHARLAERTGDLAAALESYTQAVSANSENLEAVEAIDRLRAQGIELAEGKRVALKERLLHIVGPADKRTS